MDGWITVRAPRDLGKRRACEMVGMKGCVGVIAKVAGCVGALRASYGQSLITTYRPSIVISIHATVLHHSLLVLVLVLTIAIVVIVAAAAAAGG